MSFSSLFGINSTSESPEQIFSKHASVEKEGAKFLSEADFICAFTGILREDSLAVEPSSLGLLFKALAVDKQVVSLEEFVAFHDLLGKPDAEFLVLHRLISKEAKGNVSVDAIKKYFSSYSKVGDTLNLEPVKGFLNTYSNSFSPADLAKLVTLTRHYAIYSQFKKYDPKSTGHISGEAFRNIIDSVASHRLHPTLREKIPSRFPQATIADVLAFSHVVNSLDLVHDIITKAGSSGSGVVSFNSVAALASQQHQYAQLSPSKLSLLFQLLGVEEKTPASISAFDLLFNPGKSAVNEPATSTEPKRLSAAMEIAKSAYNFALGSVAGAIGATVVYPIDLVKTRMQNQRKKGVVGQVMYKNSWDCFKKVVRNEGFRGLYSGLIPQLVGVAPEKAIKLTMNDLVRSRLRDSKTGELPLWAEILAGCTAGGSQVLFTNPLEIVKIRLQVQGEVAKSGLEGATQGRVSAMTIVRQLGLLGLYKGVGACLLRDIPFSGIYFPVYAHLKKDVFNEGVNGKKLSMFELLGAGALAGMPAAYLVTPADVIKTRLQVQARAGETTYTGISDAFVKIMREEGPRAFFKGGLARIFRSSPQFGVTLASYELLKTVLPVDFGDSPNGGSGHKHVSPISPAESGVRNSLRLFGDLSIGPTSSK